MTVPTNGALKKASIEIEDLRGRLFGDVVAVDYSHTDKTSKRFWKIFCNLCQKEHIKNIGPFLSGVQTNCGKECGKLQRGNKVLGRYKNTKITILSVNQDTSTHYTGGTHFNIRCDCGTERVMSRNDIFNQNYQTCGKCRSI